TMIPPVLAASTSSADTTSPGFYSTLISVSGSSGGPARTRARCRWDRGEDVGRASRRARSPCPWRRPCQALPSLVRSPEGALEVPLGDHRLSRLERRPVGGVAQQRLAHALAEDAALAARGAHHDPRALGAVALAPHRAQPARGAVQGHCL